MSRNSNYCLGDYKALLRSFIKKGYDFVEYKHFNHENKQIVLRHDIDYDVELARLSAMVEYELGITSTYFFLLRSPFYNPFAQREFNWINEIKEMGHTISIHFDPTLYDDFNKGFDKEVKVFELLFKTKINIISLHRPNEFFLKYDQPIAGIEHTYQKKYFKDKKYISDSTGVWRFGSPLDSSEFKEGKSIHLLIHPIWWFVQGLTNLDVLKNYFKAKIELKKNDFLQNSILFKQIVHEL